MNTTLTYTEIKQKLIKIERVLKTLDSSPKKAIVQEKVEKLTLLKESYLKQLKEQEKGTIFTDDESKAEKLAKKGLQVKLTNEQEVEVKITEGFIDLVQTNLEDALRDLGEEISTSEVTTDTDNLFTIKVKFTSGIDKSYKFEIEGNNLLLDQTPITAVKPLPSGEPEVSADVLKKGFIDYFGKDLEFEDLDQEEPVADTQGALLEVGDSIKVKDLILNIGFDSDKKLVYLEAKGNKKRVYGGTKQFKSLLEMSEKLPIDSDDFDDSWVDDVLLKQADDYQEKQANSYTRTDDDAESGITEILEGVIEIVVQMDSAMKAQRIYKDGGYKSRYGIGQSYSDTYVAQGNSLENDLEGMEKLLEEFQAKGVGIMSESVSLVSAEEVLESEEPLNIKVGDRVKISKEYGGARGKVTDKRGSFIVLDGKDSYHESDVVSVRRDFNEDLHIGHRDDEPGMLAQTAFEIANYAADIYKMLKYYESLEGDVNFPNWWQSKVILARDYVSKAAHWLEYETRELGGDQNYLSEKRKCKYNK